LRSTWPAGSPRSAGATITKAGSARSSTWRLEMARRTRRASVRNSSIICALTRSASLFPVGSEGLQLIADPIGSAVLAAPAGLAISLALLRWQR
jgi:hypothetical protein